MMGVAAPIGRVAQNRRKPSIFAGNKSVFVVGNAVFSSLRPVGTLDVLGAPDFGPKNSIIDY